MSPVRVVVARGDPLERGRTVGYELADLIRGSLEFYWRYLVRRGVGAGELPGLLAPYLAAAERELPDLVELVTGMAEGSGVSFWELFCVNAFEELEPLLEARDGRSLGQVTGTSGGPGEPTAGAPWERCSTVTISGPGYTLLGHNEQWLAGDVGHVAVVVELPDDGPALVSPTLACCLPAVGMNEYRVAQGIQSLTAGDDGVGIPRVLVSRHALVASSPADALRRATLPGRAGGYGHSFAFGSGSAMSIETSATRFAVNGQPGSHTNHYTDSELADRAPPPSQGSLARLARLQALVDERSPATPAAIGEILADHGGGGPQTICEHGHDDPADEASAIVFSMICDLDLGRMWVAPGSPCVTAYEEVDLAGVV
ncbi:MAG TPA: C45 family peptidase [Actinomycetota bacterium]|nr:C45 family peptidase [Actinomycetota bacterium]